MSEAPAKSRRAAIACGGTGGHLFPGLAVAEELLALGCRVTLLVSPKEVDQQALLGVRDVDVVVLPAVGLTRGRTLEFLRNFRVSYQRAAAEFEVRPPQAALAMGGFTSGPPMLAAKRRGARAFLHESNAIPGRANRWLSWIVDGAFVGFASAAARLHTRRVTVTGTPVRRHLQARDSASCRAALGLDPARRVVLVMGGSQGASGINELVARTLPLAVDKASDWQWLHLAGNNDVEEMRRAYSTAGLKAVVLPFCNQMDLALGAAAAAISRAGASSLAELAELQIPAILIPYPAATGNHQYYNAQVLQQAGAVVLLPQAGATPRTLQQSLLGLMEDRNQRERMRNALAALRKPRAALEIAEAVLRAMDHAPGQVRAAELPAYAPMGTRAPPHQGPSRLQQRLRAGQIPTATPNT